jgi:hypothetical protein
VTLWSSNTPGLTGIAGLARTAVALIKKAVAAEAEAEALQHRTEHLESLAKSVGKVLRYRKKRQGDRNLPSAEIDIIKTIKGSLLECQTCLRFICEKFAPYAEQRKRGTLDKLSKGFKFIRSESFIESQEKIINTHLQSLTLAVTLLNNLDHSEGASQQQQQGQYLREVRSLVEAIVRQVVDEQSSVFDLLGGDAGGQPSSPRFDDIDETEDDFADEQSEHEVDLQNRCPECWKRNLPVPDTALAIAVKREQSESVRGILETCEEEDIMVRDAEDWTLLHFAAHKADLETLCVLLDSSIGRTADFVNAKSKEGQTPLMQIAKQADAEKSLKIAEELIAHGCDIDTEDESEIGRSALYFAVDGPKTSNRERLVDMLIENGARKADMWEKFPEKASFYPALREQSPNRERKESTSSTITRKLSKAFSRSD